MITKKIFTILCISLISSFLISCAGKNIDTTKNADTILIDMVSETGLIDLANVTTVTNEVVVNTMLTDVTWTHKKADDGTKLILATGKYKNLELAKKYASLTTIFLIAINANSNYTGWEKQNEEFRITILSIAKQASTHFFNSSDTKNSDINEVTLTFNIDGTFKESTEDQLVFNFLVFNGYTINLSGMDKAMGLPPVDEL